MPFPIDFMASGPTPAQDQMEQTVSTILRREGGDRYDHVQKRDGGMFNFSDGTVWVYQMSPEVCAVMFDAAKGSNANLNVGVGHFPPLEIKGAKAKPPSDAGKPVLISSPAGLCSTLRKDINSLPAAKPDPYANYVAEDDPQPPPEPGGEARLDHDASGVATQCETLTRKEWDDSRFTVVRWLTTQSPRWGVIWRADIAPTHGAGPVTSGILGIFDVPHMRLTCWRDRSTGKLARAKRPLEALEALEEKTALAPLAGADVITRK